MTGKYTPEPRKPDDKAWLYEKYWGELLSTYEMAELCDMSREFISKKLQESNIPTRGSRYGKDTTVSPFEGFYKDEAAQDQDKPNEHFKPERQEQSERPNWADVAEREDSVGSAATWEESGS